MHTGTFSKSSQDTVQIYVGSNFRTWCAFGVVSVSNLFPPSLQYSNSNKNYPFVIHELERLVQKLMPAFFASKPILFSTFRNSVSSVCAHLILVLHLGEVMSHMMH